MWISAYLQIVECGATPTSDACPCFKTMISIPESCSPHNLHSISDVMTPDPVCVRASTTIEDAANLLLRMRIGRWVTFKDGVCVSWRECPARGDCCWNMDMSIVTDEFAMYMSTTSCVYHQPALPPGCRWWMIRNDWWASSRVETSSRPRWRPGKGCRMSEGPVPVALW